MGGREGNDWGERERGWRKGGREGGGREGERVEGREIERTKMRKEIGRGEYRERERGGEGGRGGTSHCHTLHETTIQARGRKEVWESETPYTSLPCTLGCR